MTVHTYRYRKIEPFDEAQLRSEAGTTTTLAGADGGDIQDIDQDDAPDNVTDLDDSMAIRGYTRIATDPTTSPASAFSPSASGGGGVSAIYRFSTTTTASDPGTGRARLNNATMSSVTEVYFDDFADAPTFDMGLIFATLDAGDELIVQQNDDATRSGFFTIDSITDNTGWWTLELTYLGDGGGGMVQNNKATTFAFVGEGGGAGGFPTYVFSARELVSPLVADWAVNALAPLSEDPDNAAVHIIRPGDSAEEGGGMEFLVPAATNATLTTLTRPINAQAGAVVGKLLLYERGFPNTTPAGAGPTTFSSSIALTDVDYPVTTTLYHYDVTTKTLAAWGFTAGEIHQCELTRTPTGNTVIGDIGVAFAIWTFD